MIIDMDKITDFCERYEFIPQSLALISVMMVIVSGLYFYGVYSGVTLWANNLSNISFAIVFFLGVYIAYMVMKVAGYSDDRYYKKQSYLEK